MMVTSANGKSLYRAFTVGVRKRFSDRYQFEGNYVFSKDMDDDSNERDPFTDRAFDINNLQLDYALSDRDIRHRFNFYSNAELPAGLGAERALAGAHRAAHHAHAAHRHQPQHAAEEQRVLLASTGACSAPSSSASRSPLIPIFEMFNTFNTENNINPLVTPGLFNFDGFLRQGVGDPRIIQLAIKVVF